MAFRSVHPFFQGSRDWLECPTHTQIHKQTTERAMFVAMGHILCDSLHTRRPNNLALSKKFEIGGTGSRHIDTLIMLEGWSTDLSANLRHLIQCKRQTHAMSHSIKFALSKGSYFSAVDHLTPFGQFLCTRPSRHCMALHTVQWDCCNKA